MDQCVIEDEKAEDYCSHKIIVVGETGPCTSSADWRGHRRNPTTTDPRKVNLAEDRGSGPT